MNEWININDRLPDEGSLVIAAYTYDSEMEVDACVCRFYRGNFGVYTDGLAASNYDGGAIIEMTFEPSHWIPLPKNLVIEA